MSKNLWWAWNARASALFSYIDNELWEENAHNPVVLLDEVSYKRYKELCEDSYFLSEMEQVYSEFRQYMKERKTPILQKLHISAWNTDCTIPENFSGGLGMLAGDYLKEASDMKVNLVAVGLLYRYGYFKQNLNLHGEQMTSYEFQDFSKIPIHPLLDENGNFVIIDVDLPGRKLYARVWQVDVGAVKLFLLDADISENQEQDRSITHHLYGGDNENRLKQEILLGFGGIRVLNKLGQCSELFHCNEGHSAFIGLERLAELMENQKLNFRKPRRWSGHQRFSPLTLLFPPV